MNATQAKSRIASIDSRLGVLHPWIERLQENRANVLIRLPEQTDTSFAAGKIRAELRQLEHGLRSSEEVMLTDVDVRNGLINGKLPGLIAAREEAELLREQRTALEAAMPSQTEVSEAKSQARELSKRAFDQCEQFEWLWSAFMAALAKAEGAARQVVADRSRAQATISELDRLREEFGLNVEVPSEPKPSTADSKLAGLLGSLLRDAGHSQVIDRLLDVELASARHQVEREAA